MKLTAASVYIAHVAYMGVPDSLRSLLEDSRLRKVGVGIVNDFALMEKDYNIHASRASLVDLQHLAFDAGCVPMKSSRLDFLCKCATCLRSTRFRSGRTFKGDQERRRNSAA